MVHVVNITDLLHVWKMVDVPRDIQESLQQRQEQNVVDIPYTEEEMMEEQ